MELPEPPKNIQIEGTDITEEDFTVDESGKLSISPEFIATLPDGEYTVVVEFESGTIEETTFIVEGGVPLGNMDLGVEPEPTGAGSGWSLFDLCMTLLTILAAFIFIIKRKKKDEEDEEDEENADRIAEMKNNEEDKEDENKEGKFKRRFAKLLSIVLSVIITIFLFITQDFTAPMVIFDRFSLWFALITAIQILQIYVLGRKKENDDEEDDQDSLDNTAI